MKIGVIGAGAWGTALANLLAEKGYDVRMGARPMARVIQEHLKKPLANELLFGDLVRGGRVNVSVRDGELFIAIEKEAARV